jgi:hypothetical protein
MRALDPEVVEVIWQAVEPLLPAQVETHPLGCHQPRVPDRLCLWGILIRLVTGSSWVDIEAITDRAKLGWKWSVASETHGIPIGWATDGAN